MREQPLDVRGAGRAHRHEFGERMALLHLLQPRGEVGPARDQVELVGDEQHRLGGVDEGEHRCVLGAELAGLDDQEDDVDVGQRPRDRPVERAVEGGGVARLEPGRVDEHELARPDRADAGDPVPRGLRLVRRDADLLRDERVDQGRLADVGPADDGDQAAALSRPGAPPKPAPVGRSHQDRSGLPGSSLARSASSMRRAASCSAARRDLPSPVSCRLSAGTAHSTSKVCACAWPRVARIR